MVGPAAAAAAAAAAMASSNDQLKKMSAELKRLSLRKQQLLERKKLLCIFLELRRRTESGASEESASHQREIERIDVEVMRLTEAEVALQETNKELSVKEKVSKKVYFSSEEKAADSGLSVIYVEAPPSVPAPTVILDVEKLPMHACKTQCPECCQFVTTETSKSISSVTWLVCLMTALIGCAAGCCLLPFCMDRFKSTKHTCPRCRSQITTVKKL